MKNYKKALLATTVFALGTAGLIKAGAQFEGPPYRIDAGSSQMHMIPVAGTREASTPPAHAHKIKHFHRTALNKHAHHERAMRRQNDIPHNPGDFPADLRDYERTDPANSRR